MARFSRWVAAVEDFGFDVLSALLFSVFFLVSLVCVL